MPVVSITLIGKPGCPLCDEARVIIDEVRTELAARPEKERVETELAELNILEDEQLARMHSEDIPVVFIGEKRHAIWRVDRDKFTAAVTKAARGSLFSLFRR